MLDHLTLMVLDGFLIAVFFSFLWKRDRRERWLYFWKVFGALVMGAIVLAWVMYSFPRG